MSIKQTDLNGAWRLRGGGTDPRATEIDIAATVPGNVHHELLKQELLADPFFRRNEIEQQWVAQASWEYSRNFHLDASMLEHKNLVLCCDGLDTLAEIFVNGKKIAATDNMFISWRWDVRQLLKPGENQIKIVFFPPLAEMERRAADYWLDLGGISNAPWHPLNRNFLRKCHCHSGWDWGPCLPGPGIWRDIYLEAFNGARLLAVTHQQEHLADCVKLRVTAFFDSAAAADGTFKVELAGVKHESKVELDHDRNSYTVELTIENPDLWWPAAYGEQHLYSMLTSFAQEEVQEVVQKIGFRDCRLIQEPDEFGTSFYFRINGIPVFAKGNNWIPSDIFNSRLSDDQIRWELTSAVKANNNMIRVWGGGLYERDSFYDICDELGLMVWQDFLFACHKYPVNESFLDSIQTEVRQNIRRLANHPSLVLWCGNNECEQGLDWGQSKAERDSLLVEYDQLYIQTIMPIVRQEDPGRDYWPSSPSNGIRVYGDSQSQTRGDTHYWGVWHGNQPFSAYLEVIPRFSSEFGFQSFPAPEILNKYTLPEDRNVTSPVLEHFQRCAQGNQKMINHISREFLVPSGWENTLYISQVLQALSIKVACEHWRRVKPRNMGTLIWQLNDIWPGASWSSIDYEGRWKILHYFERKFFAPILVSSVRTDDGIAVWGTSDVNLPISGKLTLKLEDFSGREISCRVDDVELAALESKELRLLQNIDLPEAGQLDQLILRIFLDCGKYHSENTHQFVPSKAWKLQKPQLEWDLHENNDGIPVLTLSSSTFAPYVWIRHADIHGVWSDNGMHLFANEQKELLFEPRFDCQLEELKASLKINNLWSQFQNSP